MNMIEIFTSVQSTSAVHYKYIKEMEDLFIKIGISEFFEGFTKYLMFAFNQSLKLKNPYMDRYYDFCVLFIDTLESKKITDGALFVTKIFDFIFNCLDRDVNVRYHACLFIYKYIQHIIKADKTINEDLYEELTQTGFQQLQDINLQIRILSANILKLLQNFENNDSFSLVLIENLNDVIGKVRAAVLDALSCTVNNLPYVVDRCRDVDEHVRITAYKKVAVIPVQTFTIEQRHFVLKSGLRDRKEPVKKCLNTIVLPAWLKYYEFDYIKFFKALQLDSNKKEIEDTQMISSLVFKSLFNCRPIQEILEALYLEEKLIPLDQLTWQSALFWKNLILQLKTKNLEEYWELILPETVHFCNYVDKFYSTSKLLNGSVWQQQHFLLIFHELICIAVDCDITDEASRRRLTTLLVTCLKERKMTEESVNHIMTFFQILIPNIERRINFFCELISDIRSPLESKFSQLQVDENKGKKNMLNDKIRKLMSEKSDAIKKEDYQLAKQINEEISLSKESLKSIDDFLATTSNEEHHLEKNDDPELVSKCLDIIIALLQCPKITGINSALQSLKEEIFMEIMTCQDSIVRGKYFKCYGIICSLDKTIAKENIQFFCLPIVLYTTNKSEDVDILIPAIGCVGDLLLIHGTKILLIDSTNESNNSLDMFNEKKETTLSEIVDILCLMLDDTNLEIRESACEVLIKLMISKRIESPDLFSRLFVKWINPATAENTRYRQLIGTFIEVFCQLPNVELQLEESIIPILRTISRASPTSPLSHISEDELLKSIIKIINLRYDEDYTIHENLATRICSEIMKDYLDESVELFVRALLYLELYRDDDVYIHDLLNTCEDIIIELKNKAKKYMEKFIFSLKHD